MEVNEYISNDVQNYEKLILSLALWLGSMTAVWYEIRVFWLVFFDILPALGSEELWRVRNSCCFLGRFLAFLWLKVVKKHGVSEICAVFCVDFWRFSGSR